MRIAENTGRHFGKPSAAALRHGQDETATLILSVEAFKQERKVKWARAKEEIV